MCYKHEDDRGGGVKKLNKLDTMEVHKFASYLRINDLLLLQAIVKFYFL